MVKYYPWYDCNVGIKVPFEQSHISANDTTVKDVKYTNNQNLLG